MVLDKTNYNCLVGRFRVLYMLGPLLPSSIGTALNGDTIGTTLSLLEFKEYLADLKIVL